LSKIYGTMDRLANELGHEPSDDDLAGALGLSAADLRATLKASQLPLSLERPIGDTDEARLGDLMPDEMAIAPDERAQERLLKEQMQKVMDEALTAREQSVLRLRFGLGNGDAHPLEKVGQALGLTRERVRQIELEALRKLRHVRSSLVLGGDDS